MLELKNIVKTFEKGTVNEHQALGGISLTLGDGEFVTLIGSNGAGKSTLFGAIAGEFYCDSGRIALDGRDITNLPEYKRARMISRIFQDPLRGTAPDLTVAQNIALAYARGHSGLFAPALSRPRRELFKGALAKLNMGLEDRMDVKMGGLSGGQRQAVTLLMATINTPRLLLLDEHTAALDPVTAERVLALTRSITGERHITTMMITHSIDSALTLGTRTIMLDQGAVVLDLSGPERAALDVPGLLELYRQKCGRPLTNDRMLLSR
jgi:putative ABC transport system ATP-binding protein